MPTEMDRLVAMMEETEEYFDDVTEVAEKNFKHSDFREYSRSVTATYKRDYAMAEAMYDKCIAAYEAIEQNEPTKARLTKLQKAHDAFLTVTAALDESNGMFTAYLDEGVAGKAAGLLELFTLIIKGQQKQVDVILDDIEDIEKLLKKAKKEVTEVKIQMGFNLAMTAVALCFPALRGARALYAALGTAGVKLAADEFLGPTGASTASAIKTTTLDYAGIAEEMGKAMNVMATIYSTVDTATTDAGELGKAEKTVTAVKKKLTATIKAHTALVRLMKDSERDLMRLAIALEKAVKAANDASSRYAAHEMTRYDLLSELEDAA